MYILHTAGAAVQSPADILMIMSLLVLLPLGRHTERPNGGCDLQKDLAHLSAPIADYGAMQADEMLLLFGLLRTSSVHRVLEIGGRKGDSAFNFLQALRCKAQTGAAVISVDINRVKHWKNHPVRHKVLVKDAINLTMADVDGSPVDAILLDCHAFYATQHVMRNAFERGLLAPNGFIFLHDTGLHRKHIRHDQLNQHPIGWVHQPVERLIAQWISSHDCAFQRVSMHDDGREHARHGLTIMQRRVDLSVDDCSTGAREKIFFDYEPQDCRGVQEATRKEDERCPVRQTISE